MAYFSFCRFDVAAAEHQDCDTVGKLYQWIVRGVEHRRRIDSDNRIPAVAPRESVEPIPILQRRISTDQRSAFCTVEIRLHKIELSYNKGLAENAGCHHFTRHLRFSGDGGSLRISIRQPPRPLRGRSDGHGNRGNPPRRIDAEAAPDQPAPLRC